MGIPLQTKHVINLKEMNKEQNRTKNFENGASIHKKTK